jgi:hypothetical protein
VNELVDAVVAAWSAWEAAVARRDRVAELDDALAPVAVLAGCTVSEVRAEITGQLRDGCSVRQVVTALVAPDLFDDDGTPWAVAVPVGEYL